MSNLDKIDPLLKQARAALEPKFGVHNVKFTNSGKCVIVFFFGTIELLKQNNVRTVRVSFTEEISNSERRRVEKTLMGASVNYYVYPGYINPNYHHDGLISFTYTTNFKSLIDYIEHSNSEQNSVPARRGDGGRKRAP